MKKVHGLLQTYLRRAAQQFQLRIWIKSVKVPILGQPEVGRYYGGSGTNMNKY